MTVTVTYTLEPGDELDASHATGGLPRGQFNGDVTDLSDGGFAVAYLTPFFGQDIPGFTVNGGTGEFPFDTADISRNAIGTPVITTLANGNLAIVWKEGASGAGDTIYSSVYDVAAGTYTARDVSIAANAALTDPEVTAFSDGFFGIVATDGTDVYFRFMNQDGTITDGFDPFVVGPGGSIPAVDPAVATLTDNGFVVTYKHGANVEARIYDINGNQQAPLGGIVVADVGTGGSAKVAAIADNAFLVVYDDQSGTPGIYLRGFNSQGKGGDPVRVDVGLGQRDVADPQITILKNGFILVTYTNVSDDGAGGTDLDVVGRVFDRGGTPVLVDGAGVIVLDNTTANDESHSSIATLLDGRFITTWTDTETDGRISGRVDELVRSSTGDGDDDVISGDALRDTMDGGGGADTLRGFGGADVLIGGDGADTLDGGDGADTASYAGSAAGVSIDLEFDTASGGDADGDSLASIENLIGSSERDILLASAGDNRIEGGLGNDTLFGDGGTDTLLGGDGNDVLQARDVSGGDVFDGGDGDADTLFVFGANIYDFTTASIRGVETLLFGASGMSQTARFDAAQFTFKAVAAESHAGASDVVVIDMKDARALDLSGVSIAGLTEPGDGFMVNGGGANETITGSSIADRIDGGAGNDTLNGGSGADRLTGGAGNDSFIVDKGGDRVVEASGGGVDRVFSSTSYTLQAGQEIEALQLLASTGSTKLDLTGNAISQSLVGNNGDNILNGGVGRDAMTGRGGNDTYIVDNLGDRITEAAGKGTDTVLCSASYALAAGQEIEALQLLASTGSARLNLNGNAFGQRLVGNSGANVLDGKGGNDLLIGRGSADSFLFSTAPGSGNLDHIADFATEDTVRLSKSVFSVLATGQLSESAFKNISTGTTDTSDRILYKQTTGELFYDADGSGKGTAVKFAVLDNKVALTHADFLVV